MGRDSRFDKLEHQRPAPKSHTEVPATLSRFETEASAPPAPEPVLPPASPPEDAGLERLKRFEEDGAGGLKLDVDPLAELPMLRCPLCHLESSKWDKRCIYCEASLTSLEAIAYNLQLVEARRLAFETEREVLQDQREAGFNEVAQEKAALILNEERLSRNRSSLKRQAVALCVALCAFVMVWVAHSYVAKCFFFVLFVAALGVGLPASVWAFLGQGGGRRQ